MNKTEQYRNGETRKKEDFGARRAQLKMSWPFPALVFERIQILVLTLCSWSAFSLAAQTPSTTNSPLAALIGGTNLSTSLSGYVPDDKYRLRAGDKVSLQILEDRDLPK